MKLTIDRKIWARGNPETSRLLSGGGPRRQCCVGLYLSACGVPDERLVLRFYASSNGLGLPPEAAWLVRPTPEDPRAHGTDAAELYTVNDDQSLFDAERETKIAAIFAEHDVDVEFVG